jgi:hypothetical protein
MQAYCLECPAIPRAAPAGQGAKAAGWLGALAALMAKLS